jgi:hypothetical protein
MIIMSDYNCVTVFTLALARVINYAPRVMLQIVASLTDNPRDVIYNQKMFIVESKVMKIGLMTLTPVASPLRH